MNSNERGSILLDIVLFLALLSVMSMALMGQLVFMTKVSAQEDARVQGLMAARVQLEDMRTKWTYDVTTSPVKFTTTAFDDNRLKEGYYSITKPDSSKPHLYQVEIWINDKTDKTVYRTISQVWVKP